ncbi:MAG: 50S ribosomal protein L21 [Syntrophorhabdaceae bacterium]|nr:50S ribosomal protein L21 [Syntrophorhabdaceae bacterium]
MYAVIENGGKQYKVAEGDRVRLERISANEGDEISIKEVLAVFGGERPLIGSPYVDGAYVQGKIISQGRARKVIVFKYKRRKDYKKKNGHRQLYTELLIERINVEASHGA